RTARTCTSPAALFSEPSTTARSSSTACAAGASSSESSRRSPRVPTGGFRQNGSAAGSSTRARCGRPNGKRTALNDFAAEDLQREQRLVDEAPCFRAVLEHVRAGLLRVDRQFVDGIHVAFDALLRAVVGETHAAAGPA